MNRLGKIVSVLALGLCSTFSACGKSNSGASGAMFIESCALNCNSNGAAGGQVSCGVISIFQNQEISVLFSKPVDFGTVGNQSFQISESGGGSVPVGAFVPDPFDSRRVIFRPDLSFDVSGNPVFGFRTGASYDLLIPGTKQGDSPPFISSTGGTENSSRMACTFTTDLGISDPVAGPPIASVFVSTTTNPKVLANGAVNVLLTPPKVTMVFNDLMNIGTLVLPGTGASPSITVKLDPDGNIANTSDQVVLQGTFTFNLDQLALQTTVVFTAAQDFPSAGSNLASPRRIIVNLSSGIKDLKGNALGNAGPVVFTPARVVFPPTTIPVGGEQFTFVGPNASFLTNCDQERTGASWGEATDGLLTPGIGGGSGRLGDLKVANGETVTLHTGPTQGVGRIQFRPSGPLDGDTIEINGVQLFIVDGFGNQFPFVEFEGFFPALTLTNLVTELNSSNNGLLTGATYAVEHGDTLLITFDTPGSTGQNFTFDAYQIIGGNHIPASSVLSISGPTVPGGTAHMLDGVDSESFAAGNLLDNFDYQASPGGTPNPILVSNGVFEFASVKVESGGTLRFVGPNAARLMVRGRARIDGVVDVSGESPGNHPSDSPQGQIGGRGGPKAGGGGFGGDRPDNSGTNLIAPSSLEPFRPWDHGIVNLGSLIVASAGVGVGQVGTIGAGPQGVPYPPALPIDDVTFGDMQTNGICESEQVGGAGGGGAYSLDGDNGRAFAISQNSNQGQPNTPPDTGGGQASDVGLESPTATPKQRKLTPERGYLLGGSGGGGGGVHVAQTTTNGNGIPEPCVSTGAQISIYRSHSGAAGGGGGGAIQVQAGRSVILQGGIDASGGDGGSADAFSTVISATQSAPGGAGSGGAILLQAKQFAFSAVANRMSIAGGIGGLGSTGSIGGFGGAGLARIEALTTPIFDDVAAILEPFDPQNIPNSINYLGVGTFVRSGVTPGAFQGAQSCWMRPTGSFFAVQFQADIPAVPPAAAVLGWDMDLEMNFGQGPVTVSYRGPNGILPGGESFETNWGQLLEDNPAGAPTIGAPLVVRFQGAKLSGQMPDPCNVEISGPSSPLSPGSLTPWVRHPSELNSFGQSADMIRFAIIFDASKTEFAKIVGVKNLHITAQPD